MPIRKLADKPIQHMKSLRGENLQPTAVEEIFSVYSPHDAY